MKVFCTLTREQASLYAAVVKEAGRGDRRGRRHPAQGAGAGHADRSSSRCATIPAQFLGDNSAIAGRSRQAGAPDRDAGRGRRRPATARSIFTQFAEMGELLQRHLQETFGARGRSSCTAACRRRGATAWWSASRTTTDAPPIFRALAQGRRHRPEPDRAPTTSSTSTAGGTRPSRTRPPTAPSASARRATCRSTSSSAPGTLEEKIDEMIERKKASPRM